MRKNFDGFILCLTDTKSFLQLMPFYSKRDGAAVMYAFNCLVDYALELMKDSLNEFYGLADVKPSPRDIIKQAGAVGLIAEQERWLSMLKNRNLSTHDYMSVNQEHYCELIRDEYLPLMDTLEATIACQIVEIDAE